MKYLAILALVLGLAPAANAASCIVADPTGTPLNVRSSPNGTIIGALHNGTTVLPITAVTVNGKHWFKVEPVGPGKTGWVFFDHLEC